MGFMRALRRHLGATVRVHLRAGHTIEGRLRLVRRGGICLEAAAVLSLDEDSGETERKELEGRLWVELAAGSLVQVLDA